LSKNLLPLIDRIHNEFEFNPRFLGTFFGHTLKKIMLAFIGSWDRSIGMP
ncbi:unnamed protein product, partial [marine sediment metagenome]